MKITLSELTDPILARSALRGDITRRGSLLIDNDEAALRAIFKTLVPSALAPYGIEAVQYDDSWTLTAGDDNGDDDSLRIGDTTIGRHQLISYLVTLALTDITGDNHSPSPLVYPAPCPSHLRLTPHF